MDPNGAHVETDADDEEDYSPEELLEQAQSNAQAVVMATVAFLTERGMAVDDWVESVGRTFARAWDEPRPWDADEFMDAMLMNLRSLGAEVVSSALGPDRAEAVTVGFPDPDLCAIFGVDASLVARFNDAAAVIARERGLTWEWRLADGQTHYATSRTPPG